MIEVDLGRVQSESVTTAIQAPTTTPVSPLPLSDTTEPSGGIAKALNLQLQGA